MLRAEAKTGQSADILKRGLINPILLDRILKIPGLPSDLSVIDLGSGDATSSQDLIVSLLAAGRYIRNLALVDADITIFPDLVGTATQEPINSFKTQVVQAGRRDVVTEFLQHFEGMYDLALSQLVLHQIEGDHDASYLMYLAYLALKPLGDLLVVNLHPEYLQYLAKHEPKKFKLKSASGGLVVGTYNFDSSGSSLVHSRSIENQLSMFLALGFDPVKMIPMVPGALADHKPRYLDLAKRHIPMFYLMQLRKSPSSFISSTAGSIDRIKPSGDQWITVTFADGDEVVIPSFKDWKQVGRGDNLILHEIRRKEVGASILNYWVIDANEKIRGGQLVVRDVK